MYRYSYKRDMLGKVKGFTMESDKDENFSPNCICNRKFEFYQCTKCFYNFNGRLVETCPSHRDVTFLLDARACPSCKAPTSYLKLTNENELNVDSENYRAFKPLCTSTPTKQFSDVKSDGIDEEEDEEEDEDFDPNCVCYRKCEVYNCQRCYQFFEGRLTETCPSHSDVVWLLDIDMCPYCQAPKSFLKISDEDTMRLAEGNDMPDDSDLD